MAKPRFESLQVRKLADRSEETRIVRYDPETGVRKLVNPATPGEEHEPWPLAGLAIEGDPPKTTRIPTSFVDAGRAEGWLELADEEVVHRPGGPESDPWRATHTFRHASSIVLKTIDGDVRYKVVRQPDKYDGGPENGTGEPTDVAGDPETSVDWFYDCELA